MFQQIKFLKDFGGTNERNSTCCKVQTADAST